MGACCEWREYKKVAAGSAHTPNVVNWGRSMRVIAINGMDVETEVIDGGLLSSRRHLNTRGKTATMPSITEKDWADIL